MAKIMHVTTLWSMTYGYSYSVIETDFADPLNQTQRTLACGGWWPCAKGAAEAGREAMNRIQLGIGPDSPLYRELCDLVRARDERNAALEADRLAGDRELAAEKIERSDQRALELQMRHPAGGFL